MLLYTIVLLTVSGQVAEIPKDRTPRAVEHRSDAVLRWNTEALEAIRYHRTPPPLAARNLAILHTAMADTINVIYGTHKPYLVALVAVEEIDVNFAATYCATEVLSSLYPKWSRHFEKVRDESLAGYTLREPQIRGRLLGRYVARKMLDDRKTDDGKGKYRGPLAVGIWRPTDSTPPLLSDWGKARPFGVKDKRALRPADPPELTSADYARDFNDVKSLGERNSKTRTADQTNIAVFWNDGAGSCTPPGHWNMIAHEISVKRKLPLVENGRLFALLNISLADAGICCWDCKYSFAVWRPSTAIHQADRDANDDTVRDPDWQPLLPNPPFPTYTSGHSTFSGAGAGVLAAFFKRDDIAFSVASDDSPAVKRHFRRFSDAAAEAGRSRIYGGIHFQFDNREGLAIGKRIAEEVVRTRLVIETLPPAVTSALPRRDRP